MSDDGEYHDRWRSPRVRDESLKEARRRLREMREALDIQVHEEVAPGRRDMATKILDKSGRILSPEVIASYARHRQEVEARCARDDQRREARRFTKPESLLDEGPDDPLDF